MGKYIKRSKGTEGLALVEGNHAQTPFGVHTRAKTLALQGLQMSPSSSSAVSTANGDGRLKKSSPIGTNMITQKQHKRKKYSNSKSPEKALVNEKQEGEKDKEKKINSYGDLEVVEASCGENVLEFESRERATRESTPCNLIRDPNTITPPSSSTKRPITNSTRANSMQLHIPATNEMDVFFAGAEEKQKNEFIEKYEFEGNSTIYLRYNFDPVKDEPLPGRYEWEKLKP